MVNSIEGVSFFEPGFSPFHYFHNGNTMSQELKPARLERKRKSEFGATPGNPLSAPVIRNNRSWGENLLSPETAYMELEKYRTHCSLTSPGQGQSTTNHQNKLQHPSPAKTQQYVLRRRCRAQHATHLQLQSRPSMFGAGGGPHSSII